MSVLRQRMIEDMQLRGLAARTQEAYVHLKWTPISPNRLSSIQIMGRLALLSGGRLWSYGPSVAPGVSASEPRPMNPLFHLN
jgi:hypothetical protein